MAQNGILGVALPLYAGQGEPLLGFVGYSVFLSDAKPLAYWVDFGPYGNQLFGASFVEEVFEFLGDL